MSFSASCGPQASNGDPDAGDGAGSDADVSVADADPFQPDALPPPENAAVFAHSPTALYRVNPDTLGVSLVGDFAWPMGADNMTDIAIDKDGLMIGVSFDRVYQIDSETAQVTFLANLAGDTTFNGLSFVPGPDPQGPEILIGATGAGNVFQIDPETGVATQIGAYGGGLGSSGDIVSVRGLGTIATVTDGLGGDSLAQIEPPNYTATVIGSTGFDSIWGLGFWGSQVYGFTDRNEFLLIDVGTGAATVVETGAVNWWGAGVTTAAPVIQ